MKPSRNIYQAARESAGLTQEAAADKLYISTESLRMYETGCRRPSDEMVVMMADLYRDTALVYQHLIKELERQHNLKPRERYHELLIKNW